MSQQELTPEPQSQGQQDGDTYQPQYPYTWSAKLEKKGAPRDEPPSTYEEPMLERNYQSGYLVQDQAAHTKADSKAANANQQKQRQQQPGSDGDAFEQGYQPYNTYNTRYRVPPWARPQPHGRIPVGRIILFLILGIIVVKLFGLLLVAVGALIGLILLLVMLVVIALVIAAIVLGVLRAVGIPIGRRQGGRWNGRRWW